MPDISGQPGQCGHRTPYGDSQGDQVAAVDAIRKLGNRHTEDDVEQRERRAGQQSQHGIADLKLVTNGRQQNRENLPVNEIEHVNDGENNHRIAACSNGNRGPVSLWRHRQNRARPRLNSAAVDRAHRGTSRP